ncbi:hypothetical protein [Kitasatospora sp. NPDC059160]|uniref:hypothetical protein n=1 Tax=Kitasatospora sp. NPDC059160 TaxID=3346748 RepID=UPI003677C7CD
MGVLVAGALVSGCSSAGGDGPAATAPTPARLRSDTEPLQRRFPELGPLSGATWVGAVLGGGPGDGRAAVPGPTDVRVDGFAGIEPATLAAITGSGSGGGSWQPGPLGCPGLPDVLERELGDGRQATWLHSEDYDRSVTHGRYTGSFFFDRERSRVFFCTVNPEAHGG